MNIKTIFLYFLLMGIVSYARANSCPQALYEKGKYTISTPTNIISSKATPSNTTTPVILFNGVLNLLRLKNLGNGVEAYPNEAVDTTFVTGGALCKNIFKLHKIRFLFSKNVFSRSGSTIDGKGTPLEVEVIYYNIKYGSFKNALGNPDGVTLVTFQILVGPVPNLLFTPLQFLLSLGVIKKPGSVFILPSPLAYIWFDVIFFITEYYAFPGSYLSLDDGKNYPAIHIVPIPPLATISYGQFAAFKHILGPNGKPLSTAQKASPFGNRPLYLGKGFAQGLQVF